MSLDEAATNALLAARGCPYRVRHVEQTTSTQDLARKAAAEGAPEGLTFVAGEQSQGRGRQGRRWVAPAGSALLASVLLRPSLSAAQLPQLSLVVGLALRSALAPLLSRPHALGIKWPNDLLLDGRKLAGVLIEASWRGDHCEAVVAGFGVNLTAAALPPEIAPSAAHLEEASLDPLRREALLADVLFVLQQKIDLFARHGLASCIDELRAHDAARGRQVRWQEQIARASGVDDEGRLLLDTGAGVVAASAGEVVFLPGPPLADLKPLF